MNTTMMAQGAGRNDPFTNRSSHNYFLNKRCVVGTLVSTDYFFLSLVSASNCIMLKWQKETFFVSLEIIHFSCQILFVLSFPHLISSLFLSLHLNLFFNPFFQYLPYEKEAPPFPELHTTRHKERVHA